MKDGGLSANRGLPGRPARILGKHDPAEAVARVAVAKRAVLLRVYRRRLRHEDLEDCYSQATLELVARARRGADFASPQHVSNALEQKFASRINDRHRATGGRSATEAALAGAVSIDSFDGANGDLADVGAEVVDRVVAREDLGRLREVAEDLTPDQRLVLACQVGAGMDSAEFCRRYGWSPEKFRKVAQRARAKLRRLSDEYETGARCQRLETDLLAHASGVASESQAARARGHLANCAACAHSYRELGRSAERIAALLPAPVTLATAVAKVLAAASTLRHLWPWAGRTGSSAGGGGISAAGAAGGASAGAAIGVGGTTFGAGAVKFGVVAVCVASAAGGYAVCRHVGLVPGAPSAPRAHRTPAKPTPTPTAPRFLAGARGTPRTPPSGRQPRSAGPHGVARSRSLGRRPSGARRAVMAASASRSTLAARREFGFEHAGASHRSVRRSSATAGRARTGPRGGEFAPRAGAASGGGGSASRGTHAAAREFGGG